MSGDLTGLCLYMKALLCSFKANKNGFHVKNVKGKKSGEKAKVNYLVKYFLSVQSFPIFLTLKKCAVTSPI